MHYFRSCVLGRSAQPKYRANAWRLEHEELTKTGDTGLVATKRSESAALMVEVEARKVVSQGQGELLKLEVKTFSDAAEQFVEWANGGSPDSPWKVAALA
jgi:ribosomal protein L15